MNASTITDLVRRLQQQHAAVGVARKEWNQKAAQAQAALFDTEQRLTQCISGLTIEPREIEDVQQQIADIEERRYVVLTKHTELEQEIAESPDWQSIADGRRRDRVRDRQQTLQQQLQLLHSGRLLHSPNECFPRIEDLDARLKESSERIDRLRAQLAAHLQQAEALLAESVTG